MVRNDNNWFSKTYENKRLTEIYWTTTMLKKLFSKPLRNICKRTMCSKISSNTTKKKSCRNTTTLTKWSSQTTLTKKMLLNNHEDALTNHQNNAPQHFCGTNSKWVWPYPSFPIRPNYLIVPWSTHVRRTPNISITWKVSSESTTASRAVSTLYASHSWQHGS